MQINSKFSSPNFSERTEAIEYIVLHFTEITFQRALERLCDKQAEVSTHYLVKEDGKIFQLVDDSNKAWHAGISFWKGKEKLNENSIGIEIDNLGNCEYRFKQIEACVNLCTFLVQKYNIPKANIIGHSDIAPDRKIDPGIFFDWQYLADNNLGNWHGLSVSEDSKKLYMFGNKGEKIVKLQMNLQQLGYKIDISGEMDMQTNFVIRAFQAHYYPSIIRKKGIDFYNDNNSLYAWDSFSEQVLQKLLTYS